MKVKRQESITDRKLLEEAFKTFNAASSYLSQSYHDLEQTVMDLHRQLEESQKQRFIELREKELLANRLVSIIAALPGGVIVINKVGNILEFNRAAEELLGVELSGKSWCHITRSFLEHGKLSAGDVILRNNRCVNLSFCPLADSNEQIVLISDITHSRTLSESANRYERLALMGEMIARFVHQIRTPLTSCILHLSNFEQSQGGTNKKQAIMQKIRTCLHNMEANINDLLTYTKDKPFAIEKVSVADFAERTKSCVQYALSMTGSKLSFCLPTIETMLYGNITALQGVLQNLIINAIQATPEAASISVNICQCDNEIEIVVADNGPGIAEKNRARIFEPFFTTKANGTGLGLAVAKSVIEMHQGRIELIAQQVRGAAFKIRLPVAAEKVVLQSRMRLNYDHE